MEVSMPTGSLCAERNVIGSALADDLTLRRQDLKMVAVYSASLSVKPKIKQLSSNPSVKNNQTDSTSSHGGLKSIAGDLHLKLDIPNSTNSVAVTSNSSDSRSTSGDDQVLTGINRPIMNISITNSICIIYHKYLITNSNSTINIHTNISSLYLIYI
jgi:hypothetical protein